jgi:hypothetical protein
VRVGIGLLALGLAWVFLQWAFDSGSLLDYSIALVLIIFGIREWVLAILPQTRGGRPWGTPKARPRVSADAHMGENGLTGPPSQQGRALASRKGKAHGWKGK